MRADAAGGAVLNVDRSSNGDFVALAVRMKRMKRRSLHQADHVRRGIDRGQLRVMRGEGMFELNSLSGLAVCSDGNFLCHLVRPFSHLTNEEPMILK